MLRGDFAISVVKIQRHAIIQFNHPKGPEGRGRGFGAQFG